MSVGGGEGGWAHTQVHAPALTLVQNACQASAVTDNSISDWCKAVTQDQILFENALFGAEAFSGVGRNNGGFDC